MTVLSVSSKISRAKVVDKKVVKYSIYFVLQAGWNTPFDSSFVMDEEKKATESVSDHLESSRVLLSQIPSSLATLQAEYKKCTASLSVSSEFRVQTQNFLNQLRSAMDYLAHEVVRFCSSRPGKVYFPIAKKDISKKSFEAKLRKWLPGIEVNRPDIWSFLIQVQHFNQGNDWISAFHELSNSNKHVKLSKMAVAGCDSVLICLNGRPAMQIGDRGYGSIELRDGASLVIRSGSNQAAIHGPQTINHNTRLLLHADHGLDVVSSTWTEFKFDEYPQQPAIIFLEIVEREVRRICEQVMSLVSCDK